MTCVSIRCRNTGVSNWISVPSSGRSVVVVLPRLSKVHRLPSQSSSALAERVRFPPSPNPMAVSQKGMCFGSWPIQGEGEMQLILEPEGVEVYIQTIASNESVHMIYTQMFILLSQGRERDAWGGFDCF